MCNTILQTLSNQMLYENVTLKDLKSLPHKIEHGANSLLDGHCWKAPKSVLNGGALLTESKH